MVAYAIIGAFGFIFLVISFIIGELADAIGGALDHGADSDTDIHAGPALFSVRSIAAFVTGFGTVGFLFTQMGWTPLAASLPALGTGVLMFGISYGVTSMLYRQQADSSYAPKELVGHTAEVTLPIAPGALGKISLTYNGSFVHYAARSRGKEEIGAGDLVKIVDFIGTTALVEKLPEP
jgi:membrane protein implicated in regulation of membrane protease activity